MSDSALNYPLRAWLMLFPLSLAKMMTDFEINSLRTGL
jgi:hypothetical protein